MGFRLFIALVFIVTSAATSPAQTRQVLTLDEALRLAGATSENVAIAEAAIARATGDRMRVRALTRLQLAGSASYDRALASEFSGLFESSGPPCPALDIDATRPLAARVAEIERALDCGAVGGFSFGGSGDDEGGGLPFGRKNTWRANLTFTQGLYSGGRVGAARALAEAVHAGAEAGLGAAKAQLALDVTRAYYDAALADRLVTIAESSHAQANALYDQARSMFQAGSRPEFELLRAEVARDNQRPAMIRARSQRDIAYLRLKQLLDLPAGAALQLEAGLSEAALPPPAPFAAALAAAGDAAAAATGDIIRSAVRQAEASVAVSEAAVSMARAQRRPIVSAVSNLGEVAYPGGFFPTDWRTNWTVGATMSVPIMTGGRLRADEMVAGADLAAAKARLQQTKELSALVTETARQELIAAEAAWTASASTVAQARRAHEIAELRYREGISTQLELADSRLALESAEANRAQAARDVQVARARIALLPQLPLAFTDR